MMQQHVPVLPQVRALPRTGIDFRSHFDYPPFVRPATQARKCVGIKCVSPLFVLCSLSSRNDNWKRLSGESILPTWQDLMVAWVFIRILHIGVEEIYKWYVTLPEKCHQEYIGLSTHKTTFFSVVFLSPLDDFSVKKHSSKIQCGEKEENYTVSSLTKKENARNGVCIGLSIQHVLPILTFGLVTCTFTFYSDNLCRNRCILKLAFQ